MGSWESNNAIAGHSPLITAAGESMKELVSGGVAGMVAWALVYPVDVLKCRVQASSSSVRAVLGELVAAGDAAALVRGMGATLTRACLVNAVIFWGYAHTERVLQQLHSE
jgi:hypothetical protein